MEIILFSCMCVLCVSRVFIGVGSIDFLLPGYVSVFSRVYKFICWNIVHFIFVWAQLIWWSISFWLAAHKNCFEWKFSVWTKKKQQTHWSNKNNTLPMKNWNVVWRAHTFPCCFFFSIGCGQLIFFSLNINKKNWSPISFVFMSCVQCSCSVFFCVFNLRQVPIRIDRGMHTEG